MKFIKKASLVGNNEDLLKNQFLEVLALLEKSQNKKRTILTKRKDTQGTLLIE